MIFFRPTHIVTDADTFIGVLILDTGFTVATHVLGYLAWKQGQQGAASSESAEERESEADWVGSEELGRSINTHSVVVRRVLARLKAADLIETRRGAGGGSRLSAPACQINLRQVFDAVSDPGQSLIHFGAASQIDQCEVGTHIEAVLKEIVQDSEDALRKQLEQTSVAEFSHRVASRLQPCKGSKNQP